MKMVICGDTVPTDASREAFLRGDIQTLFSDALPVFKSADRVLVNLECALTDSARAIPKCGPNLKGPKETAKALKSAGVTDCGLANNHMFDFGPEGMKDTLAALEGAGLHWTGAGENEEDSRKPLAIPVGDKTLAILAVSEHEYNYALPGQMGATPFDPFDTLTDVRDAAEKYDYVIVTYHGGKEHCRYPSPRLMKACRAMVRLGASAVLCQHSHIIGCMETCQGAPIVYGQGNFHFVKYMDDPTWQTGLMAQFTLAETGPKALTLELIPVVSTDRGVRLANPSESEALLGDMEKRNAQLNNGEWLNGWREFCERAKPYYEASVYDAKDDPAQPRLKEVFAHYLDCEAHTDVYRELFKTLHNRGINE